jgi:hypothetical protein
MYRQTQWRDGWLWIKTTPSGDFYPATERQMISELAEQIRELRREIVNMRKEAE